MRGRLTVLGWHNVESSWCFPLPPGGARGLRRQLLALRAAARVMPLAEALDVLAAGGSPPPGTVALTFDDGYRDNLRLAVPLLEELELPATFFLVPGLLSREVRAWWEVAGWAFARSRRGTLSWRGVSYDLRTPDQRRHAYQRISEGLKGCDRLARDAAVGELVATLRPEGDPGDRDMFLDWRGARELVRRGFTVGSHSAHHAILSRETPEEQERDLRRSRDALEERLQVPATVLAYPNGTARDYDGHTLAAAAAAGHRHALTTVDGRNGPATPPLQLRRYVITPVTGRSPARALARRLLSRARRAAGRPARP
ncbi:MAG: polysaccharide deacetylase family protein [Actinomycetota bacterium]|nr:polysaccharide deacetylase family protein [Actinomycetota bacterium]